MHKNLKPLYPYLWKYRGTLILGTVTVVLTNGIWVLFPQVIRLATDFLDRITSHRISAARAGSTAFARSPRPAGTSRAKPCSTRPTG